MYPVAGVGVENTAYGYDRIYSYLLSPEMAGRICPGMRVKIPFGGGNRSRTGVVLELGEVADRQGLKPVAEIIDKTPLLNDEGVMLLRYLKEHTFCTWFDALRLLIPAGLGAVHRTVYQMGNLAPPQPLSPLQEEIVDWLKRRRKGADRDKLCKALSIEGPGHELEQLVEWGVIEREEQTGRRIGDDRICMVRLDEGAAFQSLTPKQKLVVDFLEQSEAAALKEILYYTGVTRAVVDNMKKKGLAVYYDAVQPRDPFGGKAAGMREAPSLSPSQEVAFQRLADIAGGDSPKPAVLYGVTGSGKTAVFLQLIETVTARGRGVLVLVPEISLTAQTVEAFRSRFGNRVAVLHSSLSLGERMDEWRRIREGGASIVVGTRSAVFAPLQNIGLIVIDEEQEHTYQSDKSPRFHAREVALRRCKWHGALLLLASATPSVETYYHAKQGHYHLIPLEERFGSSRLPDVYTVDMREAENLSQHPSFSLRLLEEMRYNLERQEQSILLLNRRGYATVVKCSSCGVAADCPHCSVAMTYHSANDSLLCHICGYTRSRPTTCEHCGSSLIRYGGTGTQKLEQELEALFPDARILRVDMDTTMAKFSHERLFGAFAAHEYDIMIGTQMVAKGLNFPDVTLVGVLSADQALYGGDFRSYERSFSLLTQVVGRCGRGEKRGRAIVQTYSPDHPVIQLAAEQDYPGFYTQEVGSRKLHLYPPFCTMAGIGFVGPVMEEVREWAVRFLEQFKAVASAEHPSLPVRVLGPVPSDVLKAAGKYRFKLLLKCRNTAETRKLLDAVLSWFYSQCKTVSVFVDMNYDRI